jgi:hypothetical protein
LPDTFVRNIDLQVDWHLASFSREDATFESRGNDRLYSQDDEASSEGPPLISCAASWRTYGLKDAVLEADFSEDLRTRAPSSYHEFMYTGI